MNGPQIDYVRSKIENEGFHYCFIGYSEFLDIKDEEFHKLRLAYVAAAEALARYVGPEE